MVILQSKGRGTQFEVSCANLCSRGGWLAQSSLFKRVHTPPLVLRHPGLAVFVHRCDRASP